MKWIFNINERLPYSKVEIIFQPENELLSTFFNSVRLQNFPELLENACSSTGFSEERSGILFYNDLDEYDIASGEGFEQDEVQIYQLDIGDLTLTKQEFFQMLHAYMTELLRVYEASSEVNEEWRDELRNNLVRLEGLIS